MGQTVAQSSTGQNPTLLSSARGAVEDVTLHAFVDASRRAYATVSYARYEHASGQISVALTPIESVSVPRFELMAAVLGVLLAGLREARNSAKSTHPVDR